MDRVGSAGRLLWSVPKKPAAGRKRRPIGCAIGCANCDGQESNPNYKDRCRSGKKPTNNDPQFRSVNRAAKAMSDDDVYQHNPWRAPGNAPVYDPCGMAGGSPSWVSTGLSFVDTRYAKQGDLGSATLPPRQTARLQEASRSLRESLQG